MQSLIDDEHDAKKQVLSTFKYESNQYSLNKLKYTRNMGTKNSFKYFSENSLIFYCFVYEYVIELVLKS